MSHYIHQKFYNCLQRYEHEVRQLPSPTYINIQEFKVYDVSYQLFKVVLVGYDWHLLLLKAMDISHALFVHDHCFKPLMS